MKRSLGCLSVPAFISALVTLFLIAGVVYASGASLFSAGDLNAVAGKDALGGVTSHAEIGSQCSSCHAAPWESDTMADRCMLCHTQIRVELKSSDSLHGVLFQGTPTHDCRACHPEHRGAQVSLLKMDLADFPHTNLKFSLQSHKEISCIDCHTKNYKNPFDLSTCVYCHYSLNANYILTHSLEFGTECLNCHDGVETLGSNFNHNLLLFPLKGHHANAACIKCHLNARNLKDLKSAPQDCYSCHKLDDRHEGRLGVDCAACHTPDNWSPYKFDHSVTGYMLDGKHVEVACERCHVGGVYHGTPRDCISCHSADDHHKAQLGSDCIVCHSTAGWNQVNVNHSLFAFPLTGAHINVTCEACHQNGVLKGTPLDCNSCHKKDEPHEGRFGTDCAACHTTDAWKPAKFDHNLAAFKLTGAHVNTVCVNCHQNGVFKGTPQDCYSCHRASDKHNGQFGTNCATCHTTSTWKGATFDHNLAAFKLTGAHVNVACTSCHQNGIFKGTPQDCYSCHRSNDQHNGQFGTNCASCHSTSTWKGATFDHSLSGFPLTGRHASLACEQCHTGGQFSGTSSACVSCHADPAYHAGMFGTNCAGCHNTSNWSATYRGSHPSVAGGEGGSGVNHGHTSCRTCHTSTLHSATCTACHDGNNNGGGGD